MASALASAVLLDVLMSLEQSLAIGEYKWWSGEVFFSFLFFFIPPPPPGVLF